MPTEVKVWAAVAFVIANATAFYMGVVVGAHTTAGERVVLQQAPGPVATVHCDDDQKGTRFCWTGDVRLFGPPVGPHENDGYGVDR